MLTGLALNSQPNSMDMPECVDTVTHIGLGWSEGEAGFAGPILEAK